VNLTLVKNSPGYRGPDTCRIGDEGLERMRTVEILELLKAEIDSLPWDSPAAVALAQAFLLIKREMVAIDEGRDSQ